MGKLGDSTDLDQALLVGADFISGSSVSGWVGRGRPILDSHNWEDHPRYRVAVSLQGANLGLFSGVAGVIQECEHIGLGTQLPCRHTYLILLAYTH